VTSTVAAIGLADPDTLNVGTTATPTVMGAAPTWNRVTTTPNLAMAGGITADPALASVSAQAVIKLAVSALEGKESTIAFPGLVSPATGTISVVADREKARKIRLHATFPGMLD